MTDKLLEAFIKFKKDRQQKRKIRKLSKKIGLKKKWVSQDRFESLRKP